MRGWHCTGDLTTGVTLDDVVGVPVVSAFVQFFDPGASLSFLMTPTNEPLFDTFIMRICDPTFACYSDDASGALLTFVMLGGTVTMSNFHVYGWSDPLLQPTIRVAAVPEPASLLLLSSGLAGARLRWQRRRHPASVAARQRSSDRPPGSRMFS